MTQAMMIRRLRAEIKSARKAAEPLLAFEGPVTTFAIASYASAKDVAERLIRMCDHAERLFVELGKPK